MREQERERKRREILRLFLFFRITPFIFRDHFPIFRKKTSTPSILTAARPTVRSSDAYNHQTQLNQPVHREVKNIYIRTYRLRMLGLTSSKRNSNSKETHTADEATLDGKLQSQDLVNVSSTNLKTESFPTYFVITN